VREPAEKVDRPRQRGREPLGALERNRLRNELAERDAQVGEDEEGDQERDGVRLHEREPVLHERLADRAHRDARNRDAHLHRADEPHRVVHHRECAAGAVSAGVDELLQTRAACRHERVLGCNEQRVPHHEQENHDDSKEVAHARLPRA
jgi:hypothetical protein